MVNTKRNGLKKLLHILGPGLTTGAADDDPSGIATYAQTGAKFGYTQLWMALYMLPLMIAVQEACARIGVVKRQGLAAVLREQYPRGVLYPIIGLVVLANIINIGADIGAIGAAAALLFPFPVQVFGAIFTIIILGFQFLSNYAQYAKVLKWLTLFLLAYPATLLILDLSWGSVLKATLLPTLKFDSSFLFAMVGVLGTTISPYMFFWQSSQVAEEEIGRAHKSTPIHPVSKHISVMRLDNAIGMLVSELCAWSIIIVAAATLNSSGITEIQTAADAARALEPLVKTFPYAGTLAKIIFAIGIVGLGMLAIPVLSGSTAYATCEALSWKAGFRHKFSEAKRFYAVIIMSTAIGLLITFLGVNPIKALIYAAIFNGITSVPLLYLIARIGANKRSMAEFKSGRASLAMLWLAFIIMLSLAALLILVTITSNEGHRIA